MYLYTCTYISADLLQKDGRLNMSTRPTWIRFLQGDCRTIKHVPLEASRLCWCSHFIKCLKWAGWLHQDTTVGISSIRDLISKFLSSILAGCQGRTPICERGFVSSDILSLFKLLIVHKVDGTVRLESSTTRSTPILIKHSPTLSTTSRMLVGKTGVRFPASILITVLSMSTGWGSSCHGPRFREIHAESSPIWTCNGVTRLREDDMRVEIEFVAHVPNLAQSPGVRILDSRI